MTVRARAASIVVLGLLLPPFSANLARAAEARAVEARAANAAAPASGTEQASKAEQAALALVERGQYYERRGQRANALRDYTDAVQFSPHLTQALLALARLRWELEDYREAEQLYERLFARGHATPEVLQRLASRATARGDTAAAERLRTRVCRLRAAASNESNASAIQACEQLAQSYERSGLYVAALPIWRSIARRQPTSQLQVHIAALEMLVEELDPVGAGKRERNWVRQMLYVLNRRTRRP